MRIVQWHMLFLLHDFYFVIHYVSKTIIGNIIFIIKMRQRILFLSIIYRKGFVLREMYLWIMYIAIPKISIYTMHIYIHTCIFAILTCSTNF